MPEKFGGRGASSDGSSFPGVGRQPRGRGQGGGGVRGHGRGNGPRGRSVGVRGGRARGRGRISKVATPGIFFVQVRFIYTVLICLGHVPVVTGTSWKEQ